MNINGLFLTAAFDLLFAIKYKRQTLNHKTSDKTLNFYPINNRFTNPYILIPTVLLTKTCHYQPNFQHKHQIINRFTTQNNLLATDLLTQASDYQPMYRPNIQLPTNLETQTSNILPFTNPNIRLTTDLHRLL